MNPPGAEEEAKSSFSQILRSSSIFGGASFINVLVSVVRLKVAALLLGPGGVGIIGLFQNLISAGSLIAAMGVGASGTRELSAHPAERDPVAFVSFRGALIWLGIILAVSSTLICFLLREWLAMRLLGNADFASSLGWLSLAIGISVAGTVQGALLLSMRRIGDVARVTVISALVSGVAGVGALFWLGQDGIVPFVILPSIVTLIAGTYYVRRLPVPPPATVGLRAVADRSRTLAKLGLASVIGGSSMLIAQLAVRAIVQRDLGYDALGYVQAAWAISFTYVTFVMQAMMADFAPRLAAVSSDAEASNRMINEQTEVAVLLSGPIILLGIGAAPWLLSVLYSGAFSVAADMLRWQMIGDPLKIASWPLAYLLIARGEGRSYVATELSAGLVFVGLAAVAVPLFGFVAAGLATVGLYLLYLPLVYWLASRRTGFRWSSEVKRNVARTVASCAVVLAVSEFSDLASLLTALVLSAIAGVVATRRLRHALPPRLARLLAKI